MKLSDFLDKKLGDLSPEARRAALDAVQDIIQSRQKITGGPIGPIGPINPAGPIEIEVDPELNQPQSKNNNKNEDDPFEDLEIEINDPEELLPEEEGEGKGKGKSQDNKDKDAKNKDDEDDKENKDEKASNGKDGNESNQDTKSRSGQGNPQQQGNDNSLSDPKNLSSNNITFDDQESSGENQEDDINNTQSGKQMSNNQQDDQASEETETASDFDSNDIKKQSGTDINGRQINRNYKAYQVKRLINEIKNTIDAAKKDPKVDQAAIKQLEKDLADLVNNKDAYIDLPEEELGDILNQYIKDIDVIKPLYKVPGKKIRGSRITQMINDKKFRNELSDEEFENRRKAAIEAEKEKYLQDRENEIDKYKNFDSMHDFEIDLYDTIKDQVTEYEEYLDSYSRMNPRYEDEDNVIVPGELVTDEQKIDKPTIQVYYDQSGSWDDNDVKRGDRAIKVLNDMVQKDLVKVQMYYFANIIATDRNTWIGSGTRAWDEICNNIVNSAAKNVILMTDSDMDGQASAGPVVEVPGCVWIIWKNGEASTNIARKLRGEADGPRGNRQYAFNSNEEISDED